MLLRNINVLILNFKSDRRRIIIYRHFNVLCWDSVKATVKNTKSSCISGRYLENQKDASKLIIEDGLWDDWKYTWLRPVNTKRLKTTNPWFYGFVLKTHKIPKKFDKINIKRCWMPFNWLQRHITNTELYKPSN